MFTNEQSRTSKNAQKRAEKAFLKNGTTLAITPSVKKTITYREITIAIGVLVAMVIALTLWTRIPEKQAPGTNTRSEVNLPSTADFLFGATIGSFFDEGVIPLPVK